MGRTPLALFLAAAVLITVGLVVYYPGGDSTLGAVLLGAGFVLTIGLVLAVAIYGLTRFVARAARR